jgi:hypothetical protein
VGVMRYSPFMFSKAAADDPAARSSRFMARGKQRRREEVVQVGQHTIKIEIAQGLA